MSILRQGVAAMVLGLLVCAGACGVAEILARLLISDRPEWTMERGALADTLDLADAGCRDEGPRAMRRRVLVVGESTGELIGSALAARLSSDAGVINCARSALSIELVEHTFDAAWRSAPDGLVIIFGHNYRFAYPLPDWRLRVRRWRSRSRLLSALNAWLDGGGLDPRLGRATGAATARIASTGAALTRMIAAARAREIPVIVTTMSANLLAPSAAFPEADARARVAASRWFRFSGQSERAEALLDDEDASAAVLRFERGTWALRAGRLAAARSDLTVALVLDPLVGRATDLFNDMLRATTRAGGAWLRDSSTAIAASVPGRLPGWSTHVDHCHLTQALAEFEADRIATLLRRAWNGDQSLVPDVSAPPAQKIDVGQQLSERLDWLERALASPRAPLEPHFEAIRVLGWGALEEDHDGNSARIERVLDGLAGRHGLDEVARGRVRAAAALAAVTLGDTALATRWMAGVGPRQLDPELAADVVLVALATDGPASARTLLEEAWLDHPNSITLAALRTAAEEDLTPRPGRPCVPPPAPHAPLLQQDSRLRKGRTLGASRSAGRT